MMCTPMRKVAMRKFWNKELVIMLKSTDDLNYYLIDEMQIYYIIFKRQQILLFFGK